MRKIKILVLIIAMFLCSVSAYATVPRLINYQGRLTDSGGTPLNGSYAVTFRIYDAATAGNLLWQEAYSGLVIQKGIFSVLLGSVTALSIPFDKQYYLAVQIASDPEMSPRQQIAASAYAIRAEKFDSSLQADNAGTIANIGVSATPTANKILPLDGNAKLPVAALKTYDSGWFEIAPNSGYTKTHNLGTTKCLIQILASDTPDGSGFVQRGTGYYYAPYNQALHEIAKLTNTIVTIRTMGYLYQGYDENGNNHYYTPDKKGYARIIMLALE